MGSPSASANATAHRGQISQSEQARRDIVAANALRHAVERAATKFMGTRYEQLNQDKVMADLERAANGRAPIDEFADMVRTYFIKMYGAHSKYSDWFDANIMSRP